MADLSNKLNEILSDPQMMEQIKGLSSMLGMQNEEEETHKSKPQKQEPHEDNPMLSDETMGMIMKVMPLLSSVRQDDANTNLLKALRPLLGAERQKKVDEALKIMQMMKFLPILKSQGILWGELWA